jgi:hypothetical protein
MTSSVTVSMVSKNADVLVQIKESNKDWERYSFNLAEARYLMEQLQAAVAAAEERTGAPRGYATVRYGDERVVEVMPPKSFSVTGGDINERPY